MKRHTLFSHRRDQCSHLHLRPLPLHHVRESSRAFLRGKELANTRVRLVLGDSHLRLRFPEAERLVVLSQYHNPRAQRRCLRATSMNEPCASPFVVDMFKQLTPSNQPHLPPTRSSAASSVASERQIVVAILALTSHLPCHRMQTQLTTLSR